MGVVALLGAAAAAVSLTAGSGPPPAPALQVAPAGADKGACLRSACQTLDYALRQAKPGDAIELADGRYPEQILHALPAAPRRAIEIRPRRGARPVLDGLEVHASRVVLRRLRVAGILEVSGEGARATGVRLRDVRGAQLYVQNVRGLHVSGGAWGPRTDKQPVIVASEPESHDVTFDGVEFHDALVSGPDVHTECLMALDVQGLVIRNSRFRRCTYFGLMVAHLFGADEPRDVTIENTIFEQTRQFGGAGAPYSMIVGPIQAHGFVMRNNTFATEPAFNGTRFTGSRFARNIAPLHSCAPGLSYSDNVTTGVRCGPGDRHSRSGHRRAGALQKTR